MNVEHGMYLSTKDWLSTYGLYNDLPSISHLKFPIKLGVHSTMDTVIPYSPFFLVLTLFNNLQIFYQIIWFLLS